MRFFDIVVVDSPSSVVDAFPPIIDLPRVFVSPTGASLLTNATLVAVDDLPVVVGEPVSQFISYSQPPGFRKDGSGPVGVDTGGFYARSSSSISSSNLLKNRLCCS